MTDRRPDPRFSGSSPPTPPSPPLPPFRAPPHPVDSSMHRDDWLMPPWRRRVSPIALPHSAPLPPPAYPLPSSPLYIPPSDRMTSTAMRFLSRAPPSAPRLLREELFHAPPTPEPSLLPSLRHWATPPATAAVVRPLRTQYRPLSDAPAEGSTPLASRVAARSFPRTFEPRHVEDVDRPTSVHHAMPTLPLASMPRLPNEHPHAQAALSASASPTVEHADDAATPTKKKKKKRKTRVCTTLGCDKLVVDHGVCIRHGGGKRCNVEGCTCRAQNRGLCWKHGGYTICQIEGCDKRAKSRGMCWSHGGGTQCKTEGCEKIAVSRGCCWAHGGGKRCKVAECKKPAALRMDDYCAEHYALNRVLPTPRSRSRDPMRQYEQLQETTPRR